MRRLLPLVLLVALGGCGSGASKEPAPVRKEPAGARVIRSWADAVRGARFAAAAAAFALPATVANGGRPLKLRTRAEVDFFNRSLPCGAVLERTSRAARGRLIATFRLTDREGPGANCGSGLGHEAQVAFRVRGGRIVEWLRVDTGPASDEQLT